MAKGSMRVRRPAWQRPFLEAFEQTMMVSAACDAVGIGRTTVYEARQRDAAFAAAWADVNEKITEQLEAAAIRRARDGVARPVFQGGKLVGHDRVYSDGLVALLLKARRPDRYRDNVRMEHSGPNGAPVQLQVPDDAVERSRRAAQLLAEAGQLRGDHDAP